MREVVVNKTKMKDLEDNLLHRLTSTKGSLVDDDTLIAVLQTTKQMSEEVSEKLSNARETELKINIALEEFRPGYNFVFLFFCFFSLGRLEPYKEHTMNTVNVV